MFDLEGLAAALLSCVCDALTAERTDNYSWDGECCIQPGSEAVFDNCCEGGGQAWVVLKNGYPTTRFPNQDVSTPQNKCGQVDFATVWEVGVLRCVCVGEDDGSPCSCEQKEKDAAAIFSDLTAMLKGITCCFLDSSFAGCDDEDFLITSFAPLPNQGGCGGSTATVIVRQNRLCC